MNFIFKSWFLLAALFAATTYGAEQNAVISRDAKIDNVQLHYLTAGHGPGGNSVARLRGNFANVAADHPGAGGEIYCDRAGPAGDRRLIDSNG